VTRRGRATWPPLRKVLDRLSPGLWTAPDPNDLTLHVLFFFAEKDDPAAVLAELVKSDEFQADLVGWDNNANILD
jgi:hypothetical protein